MKCRPSWNPRVPDLRSIPESSLVSLAGARLALSQHRSAASGPRPPAAGRAPKAPPEAHTGTSPVRHRRDDVAATARSEHDHPRRAASKAANKAIKLSELPMAAGTAV